MQIHVRWPSVMEHAEQGPLMALAKLPLGRVNINVRDGQKKKDTREYRIG